MKIRYIAQSTGKGLGIGNPNDIEIIGAVDTANEKWRCEVGVNLGAGTGMLLWRSPLKIFRKLLFHTPLFNIFIFSSEYYQDHY